MAKDITLPQFKAMVEEQQADRNGQLENLIRTRKYPEDLPPELFFKKIFRFHTKIVTHEGDVIPAQDSENYWTRLISEGATEFQINRLWFEGYVLKDPNLCGPNEVDFITFEIAEFSFKINEQEFKGYLDPTNKHRQRCTKDP